VRRPRGDGAAWATLVERFAGRVRAVAQAHRLSQHDAEDVMQSPWLRLFEHIASVGVPVPSAPGSPPPRAASRSAVAGALRRLSARDAALLGMLFAEPALSYAEIAAALEMPVGSIGPTRQRSIARLRRDGDLRRLAE
jgi:DNA-directed RNA polymerase specialized sigma24 family protein